MMTREVALSTYNILAGPGRCRLYGLVSNRCMRREISSCMDNRVGTWKIDDRNLVPARRVPGAFP